MKIPMKEATASRKNARLALFASVLPWLTVAGFTLRNMKRALMMAERKILKMG